MRHALQLGIAQYFNQKQYESNETIDKCPVKTNPSAIKHTNCASNWNTNSQWQHLPYFVAVYF